MTYSGVLVFSVCVCVCVCVCLSLSSLPICKMGALDQRTPLPSTFLELVSRRCCLLIRELGSVER